MFKKNLEVLKKKNPKLAEKLEAVDFNEAKEHMEVFSAESGDLIIAYDGLALDDIYNPIRACKTNWNVNSIQNPNKYDIVLVYGLGLGYLFKRAYVSCESRILLFEPQINILRYVLQYVDFSKEFEDNRVFVASDKDEALAFLLEKYLSDDNLIFLFPEAYAQLLPQEMAGFTSDIVEICNMKKMDVNTIGRMTKLWAENSIKNILKLKESRPVDWFKGIYKGKTALITAAGPSLKDNIELIKENRDKFVIFCINRAANTLFDNGITPDFVLFADAVFNIDEFVMKPKDKLENCFIIADLRVNSVIYENLKNIITYFSKNNLIAQYLSNSVNNEFDVLETGSTVTIQAYFTAKLLGINKIIFAGLDLAFKGDVMYSDGEIITKTDQNTITSKNSPQRHKKILTVKDINGNDVLTRDDYALFIRQFEDIFKNDINTERYNISDFGAYINGMNYLPLEKAIQKTYKESAVVDFKAEVENTKEKWDIIFDKFKDILVAESSKLDDIYNKTLILFEKEKELFSKIGAAADNKILSEEFSALTAEFSRILPDISNDAFLSEYFQYEFLNFINMTKNKTNNSMETFVNFKNTEIKLLEEITNVCQNWKTLMSGIK